MEIGPNLEAVILALIPLALALVAILRAEQAYQHAENQGTKVEANTARITSLENGKDHAAP